MLLAIDCLTWVAMKSRDLIKAYHDLLTVVQRTTDFTGNLETMSNKIPSGKCLSRALVFLFLPFRGIAFAHTRKTCQATKTKIKDFAEIKSLCLLKDSLIHFGFNV